MRKRDKGANNLVTFVASDTCLTREHKYWTRGRERAGGEKGRACKGKTSALLPPVRRRLQEEQEAG